MPVERNLFWITLYQAGFSAVCWLPVFFLYLASRVSVGEVLALEAVYYATVVLLEVPSGYASDRFGRRLTLIAAASCWGMGAIALAASASWPGLVAGQVLLAMGMALTSGTDSALLYDTLNELGREREIVVYEAWIQRVSLGAMASASVLGGLLGWIDPRWAYVATAGGAGVAVVAAARLVEPAHDRQRAGLAAQAAAVALALQRPVLRWWFAAAVLLYALAHVPYEFLQPWLAAWRPDDASMWAGAVSAVAMGIGSAASGWAVTLRERLGAPGLGIAGIGALAVISAGLAWIPAPWWLPLVALRSVPMAVVGPTVRAAIHPQLEDGVRATYLSVQSLVGRLAFATILAGGVFLGSWHDLVVVVVGVSGFLTAGLWWYRPRRVGSPDP